jgi:CheY-like chemotaxis protein
MGRSLQVRHAKPQVLVVEDADDVRDMYIECLECLGFSVEGATNGRDAVRKAIARERSLIIMDLAMPVLDGWEAIRILRADPRTRRIPIIVITGQAQPELLERARAAGATEVIVKPVVPAQLGKIVVDTLTSAGTSMNGATAPSPSCPAPLARR